MYHVSEHILPAGMTPCTVYTYVYVHVSDLYLTTLPALAPLVARLVHLVAPIVAPSSCLATHPLCASLMWA